MGPGSQSYAPVMLWTTTRANNAGQLKQLEEFLNFHSLAEGGNEVAYRPLEGRQTYYETYALCLWVHHCALMLLKLWELCTQTVMDLHNSDQSGDKLFAGCKEPPTSLAGESEVFMHQKCNRSWALGLDLQLAINTWPE
ncbi:hypothetical protein GOODEAATRI_004142 [Goodea atripinnis]|uniref:Uncharacterized protein n=1 Tax=Goodea atripinnis TaxID=208336 RepID=A0ABV0MYJ7_9TELE